MLPFTHISISTNGKRTNKDLQNRSQKAKNRVTHTPLKTENELRCPGRVISSCSTCGTRIVILVTNPMISPEWRNDRITNMASGTLSFVTQILHSCSPCNVGDSPCDGFNLISRTLDSVASLIVVTLYQGNQDRNSGISNQLREIYSICRCDWNAATHKWKVHNGKLKSFLLWWV